MTKPDYIQVAVVLGLSLLYSLLRSVWIWFVLKKGWYPPHGWFIGGASLLMGVLAVVIASYNWRLGLMFAVATFIHYSLFDTPRLAKAEVDYHFSGWEVEDDGKKR